MRRRKGYILLSAALCILWAACFLTGCRKKSHIQSDQERIIAALQQVGLRGDISESETYQAGEGSKHYVIRSEAETDEGAEDSQFMGDVAFVSYEGEELLLTVFHKSGVWENSSRRIRWEDLKKQFEFVALLYGDFETESAIYQTFCNRELSEGLDAIQLDAELSNGRYCTVTLSCMSQRIFDDQGFERRAYSATVRINVYGSWEQYQKRMAEQERKDSGEA